jgi:MoaA/NifB/PqqE/SkfB family radical SAM enzyme
MTASVGSNGSLITEKMAEDLLLTGIDMVSISIDAPFEELHDRIRGVKGSFVKALDAFSNLVKAKNKLRSQTTLVLNSVLSLQNLDYILQMPDFAANLGANSFNILGVETLAVRSDVSQRRKALEIIDDMIEKADRIVDELIKRKKQNAIIDNSISHLRLIKRQFRGEKLPIRCFAGNTSLYVDCFGDVFPCMANVELNKPVANISQQGLRQLWKTKKYQAERERLGRCRNCFFTCQNEFNVLFSVKARFLR